MNFLFELYPFQEIIRKKIIQGETINTKLKTLGWSTIKK